MEDAGRLAESASLYKWVSGEKPPTATTG